MRVEVNARGLRTEEIQDAIDSFAVRKKMSTKDITDDVKRKFVELIKLSESFAMVSLETIKKYHPELLKKV